MRLRIAGLRQIFKSATSVTASVPLRVVPLRSRVCGDVKAVVEIDEIGEIVDPYPLERAVAAITLPHRLQHRAVGPDLGMTAHAGLGGRDPRERGLLDRRMAVGAVDPETATWCLWLKGTGCSRAMPTWVT